MVHTANANKGPAPPPAGHELNQLIYPPTPAAEKLTLCGFEGPEKLLEIWFKQPARRIPSVLDGPLPSPPTIASSRSSSQYSDDSGNRSGSDSNDSGVDSLLEMPALLAPAGGAAHLDDGGRWMYRRSGLRTVSRATWEEMLAIVKCQVLSVVSNEYMDAYLLSESSMFVYPNRLILKTCGTTTLLHAVTRILEIAADMCQMQEIDAIFYSRKAFLFPDKQIFPHGRWGDEVAYLDELFPKARFETSAYVVGKINSDHWCLYMGTPLRTTLDPDGVEVVVEESGIDSEAVSLSDRDGEESESDMEDDEELEDDVTLEIMMQDLDPEVTKIFWRTEEEMKEAEEKEEMEKMHGKPDLSSVVNYAKPQKGDKLHSLVRKAERRVLNETRINDIYPNSIVDDFLFDPCGYSLNGLLGPYYYTIHVTPEDICSYASFETSIPVRKFYASGLDRHGTSRRRGDSDTEHNTFEDVVSRVVERFRPGRFSVTLFTRRSVARRHGLRGGLMDSGRVPGFKRCDRIVHTLGKWDLVFSHFTRSGAAASGGVKAAVSAVMTSAPKPVVSAPAKVVLTSVNGAMKNAAEMTGVPAEVSSMVGI
ncbi:spermidine resistance protein [Irineochytrium annulatum]|nr:spermidine resistance protein [Irineochytrium annulatum]